MSTTCTSRVTLRCADEAEAEALLQALEPENEGHVTARREGAELHLTTDEASLGSTLASLDDVVRCIQAFHGIEERQQR